jgi:MFS family permease
VTSISGARAARASGLPRWWPAQWYYGWALVGALGITETASYGVLTYAFAVFIAPMSAELGWTKAQITGAYSIGVLVAGLSAVGVGRWVDRHGARGLMTAGSIGAAMLIAAWSQVRSLPAFYALWACIGLAMAAVLYEPASAVLATWFRRHRGRALTVLTFLGGFASVIFVPLATWLVARHGWRTALLWLAGIYAVVAIPIHLIILRRRPADCALVPDGTAASAHAAESHVEPSVDAQVALRSPSFRWLAVAFGMSSLATTAITVHLVPLLLERRHGAAFAGAAMGVLGLMALPGRLVFTPLGGRWSRPAVTAAIFAFSALGCIALLAGNGATAVWAFVVLFGAGFGAITPARVALLAEMYGPAHFGRISGTLSLITSVARGAAPVGASMIHGIGVATLGPARAYDAVLATILALCIGSGVAVVLAGANRAEAARVLRSS